MRPRYIAAHVVFCVSIAGILTAFLSRLDAQTSDAVELEFRKQYFLEDGESLRHIPEPLDRDLRKKWYQSTFGGRGVGRAEIDTLYLQWKDGRAQWKGATIGFGAGGSSIRNVLMMLEAATPQSIEGASDLLERKITGDWVFDPAAAPQDIVAEMEKVVSREWKVLVNLNYRDVERDVYVVRGKWKFKPISSERLGVQVYGKFLNADLSIGGGGSGDLDKFLKAVGSWIEIPLVNEVSGEIPQRISWRYHMPSPFTEEQRLEAHNDENVTQNLAAQTGLEFVKERRTTRILFVERKHAKPDSLPVQAGKS